MQPPGTETRFIADRMLGRLARYLRFLGYDVAFPPPGPDSALIALARAERRVLLTRDRGICGRAAGSPPVVEVLSDHVLEQLAQLSSQGLVTRRLTPRCCACNARMEEMTVEEARHLVPPYVHSVQGGYARCPACNIVLWEGSHWESFLAEVERGSGGLTPPESGD